MTFSEANRTARLATAMIATSVKSALDRLHASDDLAMISGIMMPDHVHIIARLGRRLSLSRAIGKLKAATRRPLNESELVWQENYYEHRLRHEADIEPFARYVFLNPYRAGFVRCSEKWPFSWRWGHLRFNYEEIVETDGMVPGAWLTEDAPAGTADI